MGIASDEQSLLFQPFQRAGQETGPIEGTELGLVISKWLAELMRDRGVQSAPLVAGDARHPDHRAECRGNDPRHRTRDRCGPPPCTEKS
jgi:hypothetical protein